jgi:predicted DNA-binding WGR domain protein
MESFRIRLEARDPARNHFRAYRIEAGVDLLGDWLVDVTYGRIGSPGRTVRHCADDEAQATRIVRRCLQRRATAPRRIGVPYQLCELHDPAQWLAYRAHAAGRTSPRAASIAREGKVRHPPGPTQSLSFWPLT